MYNLPNLLTISRIVVIPVIFLSIYIHAVWWSVIAAVLFIMAAVTDYFDGYLARSRNETSAFGRLLDPIADKAPQFSLTICIAIKHPVLWTLAFLFVIKEGFQLIAGLINLRQGRMLPGALLAGKICTTVLFVSLILLVLLPELSEDAIRIITAVDGVFMIISFISYIFAYYGKDKKVKDVK